MSDTRQSLSDYAMSLSSFDTPRGLEFFRQLDEKGLAERVLPPLPDSEEEPMAYDHWLEMLDGVERVDAASFIGDLDAGSATSATGIETSENWSGAWIVPKGQHFHRVIAKWKIPNVRQAQTALARPPKCSVWVGFGGHRRWSKAMPQLGTEHRAASLSGAIQERHVAWIQWWVRDSRAPPFQPLILANPILSPGDTLLCWLELLTSRIALFFIRKRGDLHLYRAALDMTKATIRGVDAFGSSAEWIVERPHDFSTTPSTPYPLADFHMLRFERCAASQGYNQARPRLVRLMQKHGLRVAMMSVPRRRGEPPGELVVRRAGPIP